MLLIFYISEKVQSENIEEYRELIGNFTQLAQVFQCWLVMARLVYVLSTYDWSEY